MQQSFFEGQIIKNVVIKVLFTEIMNSTEHRREFSSSSVMFIM